MKSSLFYRIYQNKLRELSIIGDANLIFLLDDGDIIENFYSNIGEYFPRDWCIDIIDFMYRMISINLAEFRSFVSLSTIHTDLDVLHELAKVPPDKIEDDPDKLGGAVWYACEAGITKEGKAFLNKFNLLTSDNLDNSFLFCPEFKKEIECLCDEKDIGFEKRELIKLRY
ncbi:hypothetical protein [Saccharibacter floricola]|uniref:Uncharacterized protein n=1 Tax=Saccharibacter floricola DSM 15669 TaxID=1123227 RepID=A0ABQ0P0S2_9PROT|nr:hypothetical protein [Saccharibacter floricola]GBQ08486.1 hypothetical protein AA15669_1797 [Saccharibacter floricola DSM 15669]